MSSSIAQFELTFTVHNKTIFLPDYNLLKLTSTEKQATRKFLELLGDESLQKGIDTFSSWFKKDFCIQGPSEQMNLANILALFKLSKEQIELDAVNISFQPQKGRLYLYTPFDNRTLTQKTQIIKPS